MRFVLLLVPPLLLAACSSAPIRPPMAELESGWAVHSAALRPLEHWHLHGRMAVRSNGDAWNAGIDWQQAGEQYTVRLTGPLGQGGVRLEGNERSVRLEDNDGRVSEASSAEQLLHSEIGWRVPLSALRYWVRGLPAPEQRLRKLRLDDEGRLQELEQGGWKVRFARYMQVNALELPAKLLLSNHRGEVRLVVSSWQLGTSEGE